MKVKLVGLYLILLIGPSSIACAHAFQVPTKDLHGVPFLNQDPAPDRDAIQKLLRSSIMHRLSELENWNPDFPKQKPQKDIAILYEEMQVNMFASYQYRQDSIMPRISRWGGAWEFDTMEEARSEAKKQCGAKCISFMENDDVVGMDRLVNDYISTRQDVIKRERRQLASAKLGILLDHPHKPRAISTRHQRQLQAVIENDEIAIGYPDAQRDYLSACSDLVFYALLPVAPKTAHKDVLKLESLQRNGLYDFHTRTALMARDTSATSTGATVDQMARFAKSYQFANDSVVKRQVRLPKNLADAIAGETIRELWIEGSVRTWKDGTPLVEDREVSPLAIRTNKGFYLGVEIHMPDDHSSCSF